MSILSEAYAEYEQYLAENPYGTLGHMSEHARIIGKAIGACLAAADQPKEREWLDLPDNSDLLNNIADKYQFELAYIALRRLTRNPVKKPEPGQDDPSFGPLQAWEVDRWGTYQDRNRNALGDAMIRMAELIKKVQ
jgi:hypothetical protein